MIDEELEQTPGLELLGHRHAPMTFAPGATARPHPSLRCGAWRQITPVPASSDSNRWCASTVVNRSSIASSVSPTTWKVSNQYRAYEQERRTRRGPHQRIARGPSEHLGLVDGHGAARAGHQIVRQTVQPNRYTRLPKMLGKRPAEPCDRPVHVEDHRLLSGSRRAPSCALLPRHLRGPHHDGQHGHRGGGPQGPVQPPEREPGAHRARSGCPGSRGSPPRCRTATPRAHGRRTTGSGRHRAANAAIAMVGVGAAGDPRDRAQDRTVPRSDRAVRRACGRWVRRRRGSRDGLRSGAGRRRRRRTRRRPRVAGPRRTTPPRPRPSAAHHQRGARDGGPWWLAFEAKHEGPREPSNLE